MNCPKCNGGSFLVEEELVKHIEGSEPQRIIIKAKRKCLSCQEEFSRLVWDELGPHRKHVPQGQAYPQYQQQQPQQGYQQAPNPYQYQQQQPQQKQGEEVVDGLKFF